MNMLDENEHRSLMDHFFKGKQVHSPQISHHGDIMDRCMCTEKGNSLASYYLNRGKKEKLVAYVRVAHAEQVDEKADLIRDYCANNGYQIIEIFSDVGDHPSFGFKAALEALDNCDGLISLDLNQFVATKGDRIRELRPLIHHFFCHGGKHLITIAEGIDTGTELGQQNAIELVNETKVGFET
ncbi:MAG: hypothetical protein C0507_19015 [Cyanobacteria bacterium PR.3.49]|nr:hypothetical protein [Cyanobacteria bacterium PR.3.49]